MPDPIDELLNSFDKMSLTGSSNTSSNTASITAAKEIANTLKPFTGKSEHLEYFLNSVDKFYSRYGRTTDNSLSEFVFSSICSKIIDEAGDFLLCRPDLSTWPEVKSALRLKFGDRIDRNVLQQQFIFLTRNKNENVIDFLERLKLIKMRLNLKINSDPSLEADIKASLINQNEVTAVTVLLSNVNSELRTLLMITKPKDIDEATSLVINHTLMEQQINYKFNAPNRNPKPHYSNNNNFRPPNFSQPQQQLFSNRSHQPPSFSQPQQQSFSNRNYQPPNFNQQSFPNRPFNQFQQQQFPSQPINIQPRQAPPKKFFTNSQVFGKPKAVFSPQNSHKPTHKPEPMSITYPTINAQSKQNKTHQRPDNYFRATGPQNFSSEELFNLEPPHDESLENSFEYFENASSYVSPETHDDAYPYHYSQNQNFNYYSANYEEPGTVEENENFQTEADPTEER